MKIAFITEYTEMGGGESNLLNLAQELNKTEDVAIFCSGKVKEEAQKIYIKTIDFTSSKRWVKFFPLIGINSRLKDLLGEFDIVHAYSVNILPLLIGVDRKIIWTTHGYWEKPFGLRARVINLLVDKVIAVSTDVEKICEFPSNKLTKIFLGVKLNNSKATLNQWKHNKIRIVSIGRFQKIKGQDILVKAANILTEKNPNLELKIIFVGDVNGNNPENIQFKELVVNLAKIYENNRLQFEFAGFQNDVSNYIDAANIVVIPSRYESFSMVAIEGLSRGRPILAPNIGGPIDIVTKEVGLFYAVGDTLAMAEAMNCLINNCNKYSEKNCTKIAELFSIEKQCDAHIKIYQELLSG